MQLSILLQKHRYSSKLPYRLTPNRGTYEVLDYIGIDIAPFTDDTFKFIEVQKTEILFYFSEFEPSTQLILTYDWRVK